MTVIPPVSGVQAGHASGGGFFSNLIGSVTGAAGGATGASGGGLLSSLTGGATQQVDANGNPIQDPGPKGDGSVGLFDGVLKKALFGGAAGAAMGFIPFLPGGPVLGGILGAVGGAAMGMFSNWTKMKAIKTENNATLAALGVQQQDPNIQKVLETGQVSQLVPMMQQSGQLGTGTQTGQFGTGTQTGQVGTQTVQTGAGAQTEAELTKVAPGTVMTVTDPATGISQQIDVSTGQVVGQGSGAQTGAQLLPATQQSVVPQQGIAVGTGAQVTAINPNNAVNPGVAPALRGGGGSTGLNGQPDTPVATTERSDVDAVAPKQGKSAEQAAFDEAGAERRKLSKAALAKYIQNLQSQVDQLKEYLAEQDRVEELEAAAAR